jgi:hypothetical protein
MVLCSEEEYVEVQLLTVLLFRYPNAGVTIGRASIQG